MGREDGQGEMFHPVGVRRGAAQMDAAFAGKVLEVPTAAIRGMVRGADPIESQRAAVDVTRHATHIQLLVLTSIAADGPQTAGELESRPECRAYSPSTVRKRVSELSKMTPPQLVQVGRRDGMAVWDLPVRP